MKRGAIPENTSHELGDELLGSADKFIRSRLFKSQRADGGLDRHQWTTAKVVF